MKKRLLAMLLGLTMVISLAGCGKSEEPTQTPAESSPEETPQAEEEAQPQGGGELSGQTISLLCCYDESKAELYEMFDKFQQDTGITLEITAITSAADLQKQLTTLAVSGDLPDVVTLDRYVIPSFADMGILKDITDLTAELDMSTYYGGPLEGCKNEDKLYGMPFVANCLAVYYNKTLIEAANQSIPEAGWTWSDYEALAKAVSDPNAGYYGAVMSGSGDNDGGFQFYPWLWSAGGSAFEADTDAAREALGFLRGLIDEGAMSPEIANWTQTDASNQFAGGKAALFTGGSWHLSAFQSNISDFEWGVVPYPVNDDTGKSISCLGGYGICITESCENVDAAWELIKFMESEEVMGYWNEASNYIPVRKDVAEASEYFSSSDNLISVYTSSMDTAQSRGPHAKFVDIDACWQGIFQEVYTGVASPDEAIAEFAPQIEALLQ
ncbi:MAG: sugar ABC transporter substrate-binding protein [Lachnospiraceae bacterium]|nr:sugar ABC transporter substrate-binding protein [Lachnospiraceae bacterium]